jgi:hypothetical protein
MQPLYVAFLKTLSTYVYFYMTSAIAARPRQKPGQRQSTEHIASLACIAFSRAATMGSGIMDCGPVFTVDDFASSTATERPETI